MLYVHKYSHYLDHFT